MKILLSCLTYYDLSGSPAYVYELSRELVAAGHEVMVVSQLGDRTSEVIQRSIKNGVLVVDFGEFRTEMFKPDVLNVMQPQPSAVMLKAFPNVPAVQTIHHEFTEFENPVLADNIKKYIAIRPAIKDRIVSETAESPKPVEVIYNPIDFSRFNPSEATTIDPKEKPQVLFVGTIDYLRRNAIFHLIDRAIKGEIELYLIGQKHEAYLDFAWPKNEPLPFKWQPPVWNIEEYVKGCTMTAGILMGRTTIEGWACGRPGIIYDINRATEIVSVTENPVPPDMDKFDSKKVAQQIIKVYESIL